MHPPIMTMSIRAVTGAVALSIAAGCTSATGVDSKPYFPSVPTVPVKVGAQISVLVNPPANAAPLDSLVDRASFRVTNGQGVPVAGVAVHVAVSGGGSIGDTLVVSDGGGVVWCHRWILGAVEGMNQLTASIDGAPPVKVYVLVLRPNFSGVRYDLRMRDGSVVASGELNVRPRTA